MKFLEQRQPVERFGFKWWLDPDEMIDHELLEGRTWEIVSTRIFEHLLRSGITVFDIGANIGWYTLIASRAVGPSGTVFAFEPMAAPLAVLHRHLTDNDVGNVVACDVALSDFDEVIADLVIGYSWSRTVGGERNEPCYVEYARADAGRLPPPDLIKIDVDGHELRALKGAEALILVRHPPILFELGDYTLRAHAVAGTYSETEYVYGTAARDLLTWLADRGYEFRYENTPDETSTPDQLLALWDLSTMTINVLAWPRDRAWVPMGWHNGVFTPPAAPVPAPLLASTSIAALLAVMPRRKAAKKKRESRAKRNQARRRR